MMEKAHGHRWFKESAEIPGGMAPSKGSDPGYLQLAMGRSKHT